MFKEQDYKKDMSTMEIKFKRNSEDMITSWQLSNFISNISSSYYKNELINMVSIALNNDVSPKNIFIMDDSFKFDSEYSKLFEIDLHKETDVKRLYHLGNPISMFPNDQIYLISLIFKTVRNMNSILNSNKIKRLNKNILAHLISSDMDCVSMLDQINKFAISNVKEKKELLKEDGFNMNFDTCLKHINDNYKKSLNKFNKYRKEETERKIFEKNIYSDDKIIDEKKYEQIENMYFKNFFMSINKLSRPIVGIYNDESMSMSILGITHINKKIRDTRFFNIKEISHNSPLHICIATGIGFSFILNYYLTTKQVNKKFQENKNEITKLQRENEEKLTALQKRLKNISDNDELNAINSIGNNYIKEKMKEIQDFNAEKSSNIFERYKLVNQDTEFNLKYSANK